MKKKQTEFSKLVEKTGLLREEIAERIGYHVRTVYRWEKGETLPKKAIIDWVTKQAKPHKRSRDLPYPAFTFIDLFAGIGGLRAGFDKIGGNCVFTSEWDLACRKTYLANYPSNHPVEGDITQIPEENIPAHDVLLAGFPCQPFSIAGISKKNSLGRPHGFLCDAQGTLFFDVARIITHHQPSAFLLENVKNLVSHDKGNTFRVIKKTLKEDLGYHIDFRIINAKAYVPQNRERIFIVGFKENTEFDFNKLILPSTGKWPLMSAVLHPEDGSDSDEPPYTTGLKGKVNPKYTLSDKLWAYLQGYAEKHRKKGNGFGYGLVGKNDVSRTLSARYYKDGSEILIRQRGKKNPRRMTPRECARLMGFDQLNRPLFQIPVSDTQAYKQFGNAVVVPVVEAVARLMLPHIQKALSKNSKQHRSFSKDKLVETLVANG